MRTRLTILLVLVSSAWAQPGGKHWVATWTTAQPLIRNQPAAPRPAGQNGPSAPAPPPTTPRPANPAQALARGFHDQTVRMIVRTSIGGSALRIKLSNPFGGAPVMIGTANVAVRSKESDIIPTSGHALSFNGKPGCTIGPGMVIFSDAVDMAVSSQTDLAVSLYLPGETGPPSAHNGLHTSYVGKEGDLTSAATIPDAIAAPNYYWLAGIDVLAPANASLVVAYGDSITEGARSTPDTDRMWPAVLSARLASNKSTAQIAVANMGIGGNRVLRDGSGASALARFDRDVLSQSGVKWVMMLEGINDIGHSNTEPVSADDLIGAFKQIIERAHTHGVRVIGCTLPPYEGAGYAREEGEAIRQALNSWIRTGKAFDAVVDFEAATRDPNNPKKLRADFDPGDHLHPNDAGYKAMAEAVDLSIFTRK
ncbi:MAG: lipolytic enzyme family [Candidatus Solibacter sp.]|nr:lipolytic enzyme family [Candidatus Solibacter sp.]